jgi:hypothetical protein
MARSILAYSSLYAFFNDLKVKSAQSAKVLKGISLLPSILGADEKQTQ